MSEEYPRSPQVSPSSDPQQPNGQPQWNQQSQGQNGQPQFGQPPYGQPQWNPQQPMYPPQQPMMPPPTPKKKAGAGKKILIGLGIVLVLLVASCAAFGSSIFSSAVKQTTTGTISNGSTSNNTASTPATTPLQAVRQVQGKVTTLGAGTFSGGKDVPVGLYNITAPSGQSGNFIVSGTDSYNDILGQGVTKIRAQISDGDQIQLSGLSSVTFTPVSTPFITTHTPVTLYAGTFIVGQDIGAGRYVATTTAGSSGNFIVSGANSANEILGQNSMGGVPSVTTDLADGDVVTISGLGQVIMTPK